VGLLRTKSRGGQCPGTLSHRPSLNQEKKFSSRWGVGEASSTGFAASRRRNYTTVHDFTYQSRPLGSSRIGRPDQTERSCFADVQRGNKRKKRTIRKGRHPQKNCDPKGGLRKKGKGNHRHRENTKTLHNRGTLPFPRRDTKQRETKTAGARTKHANRARVERRYGWGCQETDKKLNSTREKWENR